MSDGSDSGENIVVGGDNRWTYDSFVNYAFFPEGWIDQPQGPILVYFKETQTPEAEWDVGPGKSANGADAIAKGAVPGQVQRENVHRRYCNSPKRVCTDSSPENKYQKHPVVLVEC